MVCRACGQRPGLDGPLFQCIDCKWHYHHSCRRSQPHPRDHKKQICEACLGRSLGTVPDHDVAIALAPPAVSFGSRAAPSRGAEVYESVGQDPDPKREPRTRYVCGFPGCGAPVASKIALCREHEKTVGRYRKEKDAQLEQSTTRESTNSIGASSLCEPFQSVPAHPSMSRPSSLSTYPGTPLASIMRRKALPQPGVDPHRIRPSLKQSSPSIRGRSSESSSSTKQAASQPRPHNGSSFSAAEGPLEPPPWKRPRLGEAAQISRIGAGAGASLQIADSLRDKPGAAPHNLIVIESDDDDDDDDDEGSVENTSRPPSAAPTLKISEILDPRRKSVPQGNFHTRVMAVSSDQKTSSRQPPFETRANGYMSSPNSRSSQAIASKAKPAASAGLAMETNPVAYRTEAARGVNPKRHALGATVPEMNWAAPKERSFQPRTEIGPGGKPSHSNLTIRVPSQSVPYPAPPRKKSREQAEYDDRMKLQPTDAAKSHPSLSRKENSEADKLPDHRRLNYRPDPTTTTQQENSVKSYRSDMTTSRGSNALVTDPHGQGLAKLDSPGKQCLFENQTPMKQVQPPRARQAAKKVVNEAEFDAIIYGNANAGPPPPGIEIPPLKPRLLPKGDPQVRPLYLRFDPRIHYNQPKPDAWYQAKMDEISKRPSRKENFGRAAHRWHLANLAKTPAMLRQEFIESLPWSIRNDPKWFRARMQLDGYHVDDEGLKEELFKGAGDDDDDDVIVRNGAKRRRAARNQRSAARKQRRAAGDEDWEPEM